MIPYPFRYHRPKSIDEAQALFTRSADARYLAGGQTLIPAMKLRLASPSDLIDLAGFSELSFIARRGDAIVVGAATPHCEVADSPEIRRSIPALAGLAQGIGDPAVRHRGTLGGSLANSDPAADYPAAVLGLGAAIVTTRRTIPADEYFLGMFRTALDEGEIIREVSFPIPQRAGYAKFPSPASRYAMAGVFVVQTKSGARVAATGAGPCAFRIPDMEDALSRQFRGDALAGMAIPSDGLNADLHGSAEYRAHLVTVMAKRAVVAACDAP